jgi:oligopeptidase B
MPIAPPRAEIRAFDVLSPWGPRADPYYWLRDDARTDPDVLAYLALENDYRARLLAPLRPLEDALYAELVGRLRPDDATVPVFHNGYWYQSRYHAGREHAVHARRAAPEAPEQLLLDGNLEAAGHPFWELGNLEVSPDNRTLAIAEDTRGRRLYTLRFRNLDTGFEHPERIESAEADIAWADDGQSVLYVAKDPETLLGTRVMRHVVGTTPDADTLVHEEQDDTFFLGVERGRSGRFVYIVLDSTVATEVRYAQAGPGPLAFEVAIPREREHEYQLEDFGERFVIRSNDRAPNFRIASAPIATVADRTSWRDEIAPRDDVFVSDFEVFGGFLAVAERAGGLRRIRIRTWDGTRDFRVEAGEPAFAMWIGDNDDPASTRLRYVYSSPTTPATTYDFDPLTGERVLLKREPVEGDFDSSRYATEFIHAPARDGERVPVTLLYRRGLALDGSAPLYQYAYGSYGLSQDPLFSATILSLVDRGIVFAIAHVRGGQELGRAWYDDGRLYSKHHTFDDFVDVTRHLVRERYVDAARVCGAGGSAGGLLVAAVANRAPGDYRVLVAHVPFVDVVTSMLDDELPLTTNEYDEWGDPGASRGMYEYLGSYSPYDNVVALDYPALLVTSGLHDSQVQYWEPAKWVAKLRALRTDARRLVLHTNLDTGHGGKPGRFARYREIAEEYAFVLDELGLVPDIQKETAR